MYRWFWLILHEEYHHYHQTCVEIEFSWCQQVGAKSFADWWIREEKVTTPLRSLSTMTAPSTTLPEATLRLGLRWYDMIWSNSSDRCVILCHYVFWFWNVLEIATSSPLAFPDFKIQKLQGGESTTTEEVDQEAGGGLSGKPLHICI